MKNKSIVNFILCLLLNTAYGQKTNPIQLQNFIGKQIVSTVDIVSSTRSSTIGINDKNIETIPTGRKQTTKRLINFQKDGQQIKAIFVIQHIKATIYGGTVESIYDSDNTFERSGVAAIFATRFDPFVGKKFIAKYDNAGKNIVSIADDLFDRVWGSGIAKTNSATELSGIFQASAPTRTWSVGGVWVDTINDSKDIFVNTYTVTKIKDDVVQITFKGKSNPIVTNEEQSSIYSGVLEAARATGFIQKLELERETESISEAMGAKILSITTTKTIVTNKVK